MFSFFLNLCCLNFFQSMQRYKIFILFILILNNISCYENTETPKMKSSTKLMVGDKAPLFTLPGRVTFIIDRQGIIRGIYSSQVSFQKHVDEALEVLRKI